jgi:hypothetical protein
MAHTACLVCLVTTATCRHKNAFGRGIASSRHITKLEAIYFSLDIYDYTWVLLATDKVFIDFCCSPCSYHLDIYGTTNKNLDISFFNQKC